MAKLKILLVDDDLCFLEVMKTRIESWGYEFLSAENGKNALRLLESVKPNIVILDYMMPELDGIAVFRRIRKVNRKIPIIMLTAYPDKKAMGESDNLGVVAFVPKVSSRFDLDMALKTALNLAKKELDKEEPGGCGDG